MPSYVGSVMERSLVDGRSLKDGMLDLVARSVAAGLGKRGTISDITSDISDAKTAFSSWDNCMKASYCKWPAITLIIIGGLIIFSVVWCIARCLCCGVSCCCECFHCLKCCGNCCGCCDSPNKRSKYLDDPYVPPNHDQGQGGYRSQEPMSFGAIPRAAEPPQYAEFDASKKGGAAGGDELPAMPSWEGAGSKKVLVDESVELDDLKKSETAQDIPLMAPSAASHPVSPSPNSPHGTGPYGVPGQNAPGGYMAADSAADAYLMHGSGLGYNKQYNDGYGQTSCSDLSQGGNQGYGMAAGAMSQGRHTPHQDQTGYGPNAPQPRSQISLDEYNGSQVGNQGHGMAAGARSQGRRAPHQNQNGGYGQNPLQPRTQRSYDDYNNNGYGNMNDARSGTPRSGTPGSVARGGPPRQPTRQGTYPYANADRMQSPAPPHRQYSADTQGGSGYDQRSHTPNSYGRLQAPQPQRQWSSESTRPLTRPDTAHGYSEDQYSDVPNSPIQNQMGFDFTSGYARGGNASPAPQQAIGGGAAYPGYRPYKPS